MGKPSSNSRMKGAEIVPRPMCALCGQPFGKKATTRDVLRVEGVVEVQPYTGPLELVSERVKQEKQLKPEVENSDDPAVLRNPASFRDVTVVRREFWDRTTWSGGYHPFCSMRCALAFAQAAYRDGSRYVLKESLDGGV